MAPVRFVSIDDFRARKLHPNEALPVFYHELRQLVKQAMCRKLVRPLGNN